MNHGIIIAIAGILILCALGSGCTSAPAPVPTALPTPVPTSVKETTAVPVTAATSSLADTSVEGLPPAQSINLDLTKDRPTSEIHLLYQGGAGDVLTQKIVMRVFTSATDYQEYVMSDGKKPIPGNEIIAPGTRGSDRCVVYVTTGGKQYKVIDQQLAQGSY